MTLAWIAERLQKGIGTHLAHLGCGQRRNSESFKQRHWRSHRLGWHPA